MAGSKFEHHIHVDGVNEPKSPSNVITNQKMLPSFNIGTLRSDNLSLVTDSDGSLRHGDLDEQQQAIYERGLRDGIDYNSDDSHSQQFSDGIPMQEGRSELKGVIELLSGKTKRNAQKGKLYKHFDTFVKIILVLGPSVTALILELDHYGGKAVIYCSFALSILSGIYEIVEFKDKGLMHVQMSKLFRNMLRKARESLLYLQNGDEMFHYARHVEEEIDEIELDFYSNSNRSEKERRGDIETGTGEKED